MSHQSIWNLTCGQCNVSITDDNTLYCGDSFCKECLRWLDSLNCPLCDSVLEGSIVDMDIIENIRNNIKKSLMFCEKI